MTGSETLHQVDTPQTEPLGKGWRNETGIRPAAPPYAREEIGERVVRLPLGGVASTDPGKVRRLLVRPLWLLVGTVAAGFGAFVWLRLALG